MFGITPEIKKYYSEEQLRNTHLSTMGDWPRKSYSNFRKSFWLPLAVLSQLLQIPHRQ
jgi:hypothetical protein